jgi:flagellar hook protein FlgE
MIGSLTAGVGAMRSFVQGIEVVGNNISNINTVGYKGAKTRFEDTFSNTVQRGTGSTTSSGSNTITQQIGTGAKIATIQTQFSQGPLQTTGGLSDLAISGQGFFRVRDTVQGLEYVTRAGDFRVDDKGYLVTNNGFRVQGLGLTDALESSLNFSTSSVSIDTVNLRDLRITSNDGATAPTKMETFQIDQGGNINIFLSNGSSFVRGKVLLQRFKDPSALVKEGNNLYSGMADAGPTESGWPNSRTAGAQSIAIGNYASTTPVNTGGATTISAGSLANRTITFASAASYNSAAVGDLITVTGNGAGTYVIQGISASTNTITVSAFGSDDPAVNWATNAPDATSSFNIYGQPSANMDPAQNGNGRIISGSLEMANVDLTDEFANMITTQRAFQAASKLITTSDEILQDIVNLKR